MLLRLAPWWRCDPMIGEVMSAITAWYWSVLLFLPVDTFSASRSYLAMQNLASEEVWAGLVGIVALAQSLGVCGRIKPFRVVGAYMAMSLWFFASAMFLFSNVWTHAPGIYGVLFLSQLYSLIMLELKRAR